jgi:Zn-finger nucleic acid-binding protein
MERMLCESCAAVSYSAAARQIVERGDRCPRCGGVLAVDRGERVGAGGRAGPARARFRERSES